MNRSLNAALWRVTLLGLLTLAAAMPARAQNVICSTAPLNDSTNRCADTAFVQNQLAAFGPSLQLFVGTTVINGGTTTGFLFDNAGVLGNSSILLQGSRAGYNFIGVGDNIADAISRWPGTKMPALVIDRSVNWSSINDNSVIDTSVLTAQDSISNQYASFSSRLSFANTAFNWNHMAGFEDLNHFDSSGGILTEAWSFLSNTTLNGAVTNFRGVNIQEPIGSGTRGTQYGVYVAPFTKGTANWGVFSDGVMPSSFGGTVVIGTSVLPSGYIFGVHPSTNNNLNVSGTQNLTNGVTIASVNDANNAVRGIQVNASIINLNAALIGIGGNAIAPDSTLLINGNTAASVVPDVTAQFHIVAPNSTTGGTYTDTYGAAGVLSFRNAGGTLASKTATPASINAIISSQTWDGSAYSVNSAIDLITPATQSGSDHGGLVRVRTTPAGSTTLTNAAFFNPSGSFSIGLSSVDSGAGTMNLKKQGFSALTACSSTIDGTVAAVTDSSTATWGASVAGGSTNHVLAYCDGTAWTVAAK